MEKVKKERDSNFELLRIIAIFMNFRKFSKPKNYNKCNYNSTFVFSKMDS